MLERMRRKGNPSALLVGMKTGEATVENNMEFLHKIKHGTAPLTQQFCFWDYTLRTLKHQSKRTYAPQCSQQHNLEQPSTGSSLSAHQQMSGSKNYGIFTQWNSTQQKSISFLKHEANLPHVWEKRERIYSQHIDHCLGEITSNVLSLDCDE